MPNPITAFFSAVERLDISTISNLLNHRKLYCGVTKETFLQVLSGVFQNIKNDAHTKNVLKSYKVICPHAGRHKNSYIFIDSMKFGKITVGLDTDKNDLLSIEICYKPDCEGIACYNFNSLIFYPDDKPNFTWTPEHRDRKIQIDNAVNEFYREYQAEGILYPDFILRWFRNNRHLESYHEEYYTTFRYQQELKNLYPKIHPFFQLSAWSDQAKKIMGELYALPLQDDETILTFLQKDENQTPYIEYTALENWDLEKGYIEYEGLKFFVAPLEACREAYFTVSGYDFDFYEKGLIESSIHSSRLILT